MSQENWTSGVNADSSSTTVTKNEFKMIKDLNIIRLETKRPGRKHRQNFMIQTSQWFLGWDTKNTGHESNNRHMEVHQNLKTFM